MKLIRVTILFLLVAFHGNSQNLNLPPVNNHERNVDISSSQIAGCTFLGLGIATIGYTAAKTHSTKNPALWYTGGSVLATTGILILIFGDKKPQVKYWKGMESLLPKPAYINEGALTKKWKVSSFNRSMVRHMEF